MEIGFVDYSKKERNTILNTLSLLGEPTALDELGVGSLRDIYSDLLFPGISTLQTRAKYFVLIPYLFQLSRRQIENGRIRNGAELLRWINQEEDKLVQTLADHSGREEKGIIGSRSVQRGRAVKNKPSSIYWSGLRTLGIVHGDGLSLPGACSMFAELVRRRSSTDLQLDSDTYDDATAGDTGLSLFSPLAVPRDFQDSVSILLTHDEAEFLRSHILRSPLTNSSLLAFLLREHPVCTCFYDIPTDLMPPDLAHVYRMARSFSSFIYGAHIRYNMIFSDGNDESMTAAFETWLAEFSQSTYDLEAMLDPPLPIGHTPCSEPFKGFCRDFYNAVRAEAWEELDQLIINRELQVKGARSKLRKPEEYRYPGPIHNYRLDYRFWTANTILQDILNGLGAK